MVDTGKAKEGVLHYLIILDAQKCSTTSLHYYLNQHPQILMSNEMKLKFFIREMN